MYIGKHRTSCVALSLRREKRMGLGNSNILSHCPIPCPVSIGELFSGIFFLCNSKLDSAHFQIQSFLNCFFPSPIFDSILINFRRGSLLIDRWTKSLYFLIEFRLERIQRVGKLIHPWLTLKLLGLISHSTWINITRKFLGLETFGEKCPGRR